MQKHPVLRDYINRKQPGERQDEFINNLQKVAARVKAIHSVPSIEVFAEEMDMKKSALRAKLRSIFQGEEDPDNPVLADRELKQVLLLSLADQFHLLQLSFTITMLAEILNKDPSVIRGYLRANPTVFAYLSTHGLVRERERDEV